MLLRNLRCAHFKNHTAIALSFAKQLNLIVGPNGVGKTNLLDSIHYLSLTRSAFNTIDAHNIQHGQDAFAVRGDFFKQEKSYTVQCVFQRHSGKDLQRDNKPYKKLRDHIGHFPIVLTSPYDMDLIRGGREARRKFFDTILCQLDSTYLHVLLQYQHVLRQRNSLLQLHKATGQLDQDLLATYDHQLLPLGKQLFLARSTFIQSFSPSLQKHYQDFVTAPEAVQLVYKSEVASADFEQVFYDNLPQDLALQRTCKGVHHDEVYFLLNGHSLKRVGSQGQQKSFIIALRLAQFECMHQVLQFKPLLLLDDIFDKLDAERSDCLMQLIAQNHFGQVFITAAKGENSSNILQRSRNTDHALINIPQ